MSNACTPIFVGVASPFLEILLLLKKANLVHGHQKIGSNKISSKNSCKQGLMSNTCTPILVGLASLISEIKLAIKINVANFPFGPCSQKVKSAQKIMQVETNVKFMGTKHSFYASIIKGQKWLMFSCILSTKIINVIQIMTYLQGILPTASDQL